MKIVLPAIVLPPFRVTMAFLKKSKSRGYV